MIPKDQGVPPATMVTLTGGECEWPRTTGSTRMGPWWPPSAYGLAVTPSGRVSAWSSYTAEPLVCPEE